jgi:hypothetical protein
MVQKINGKSGESDRLGAGDAEADASGGVIKIRGVSADSNEPEKIWRRVAILRRI